MDAYEPTAGNGALMIGDDLEDRSANEKNPTFGRITKNGVRYVTEE